MKLKIIGKIDLNSKTDNSHLYAKYLPIYYDEGCACHYGYNCGETYDYKIEPIGYIKVDINDKFVAEVNLDKMEFHTLTDGTTKPVNFDRIRESGYWFNKELFDKYPKQ